MKKVNEKAFFSEVLGNRNEEKGFDISSRLERYGNAHKRALQQVKYIQDKVVSQSSSVVESKYRNLARSIEKCGSWLVFRDFYTINQQILIQADFCKKHLLCPLCAIRRGAKYLESYHLKYLQCLKENNKLNAYMVTFTIRNSEDLKERTNTLLKSYRKLINDARNFNNNKKGYEYNEACKALGGVYSVEIKRGKNSNLWHPHIHAIWLCEDEPDEFKLKEDWKKVTKDSHMVNIKLFYGDLIKSFCEVFKYALKFSSMSLEDTWFAYQVLSGKRLIGNFGILRGVKVDDELLDKPIDEDLPYVDLFYKYLFDGQYELVKTVERSD